MIPFSRILSINERSHLPLRQLFIQRSALSAFLQFLAVRLALL
jgi:hypothetical protein